MGKQALLLRMYLGRSADLPPDWSTLEDQYRVEPRNDGISSSCFRGIDPERPSSFMHKFDEKGRPFDARIRDFNAAQCDAQTEVLKLAVAENEPVTMTPSKELSHAVTMDNILNMAAFQHALRTAVPIEPFFTTNWLKSLRYRLLVFSTTSSMSFTELVLSQCQSIGFWTFMLAGVPIALLRLILGRCGLIIHGKLFSAWRTLPSSSYLVNTACKLGIEAVPLCVELFLFTPLAVLQVYQELQLQSARPCIPSIRTFNPFSKLSPFQPVTGVVSLLFSAPILVMAFNRLHLWVYCLCSKFVFRWLAELTPLDDTDGPHVSYPNVVASCIPFFKRLVRRFTAPTSPLCQNLVDWLENLGPVIHLQDTLTFFETGRYYTRAFATQLVCYAISTRFTDILMLPLDGLLLRTLALQFLTARRTADHNGPVLCFDSDMYPIFTSISGVMSAKGRKELSTVAGRIGLCLGLEFATNLAMLGCQLAAVIWTGRRFLRWEPGRLENKE